MRALLLTTALGLGLFATPASAVELTCNTAVQNWQNGSATTCPYQAGNAGSLSIGDISVPPPPPRVRKECAD